MDSQKRGMLMSLMKMKFQLQAAVESSLCGPAEEVLNEENMRSAFDVRVKIADFLFEGFRYRSVIPIATV